jgi:hypothetical protein
MSIIITIKINDEAKNTRLEVQHNNKVASEEA